MKAIKYGAVLIGLYLVVYYSTGTGVLAEQGSAGAATVVKALQGRG
jgi:hypothetical protein